MKITITADDQLQKKVTITHLDLVNAEKLLKAAGMPEDSLSPDIHHLLVGMTSYAMANTLDPKDPKELVMFLRANRRLLRQLEWDKEPE